MIPFDEFWALHAPMPEYEHLYWYCKKIWESLPAEKQEIIMRNIRRKKTNNLFVDYNPYYAIQKNGNQPRKQVMSFDAYYARFHTTEPCDGWHMENPTGNKVIYVKN